MHNNRFSYKKINDYAKILIVVSFAFLAYGIFLDLNNTKRLIDPTIVENNNGDNSKTYVEITGNEDIPDNDSNVNISEEEEVIPDIFSNGEEFKSQDNNDTQNLVNTIYDSNNNLRKNIESNFGIKVYYGDETKNYRIPSEDLDTYPITDPYMIEGYLSRLYTALSLYPSGFFQEIRDGGIPLTIYLIDSYSTPGITGVTDSNNNKADISIATRYGFEESFYHESYHYIERYMFKKNIKFNSWDSYNPSGYTYGNKISDYVYNITFSPYAYFVNTYAQTNDAEDRASTFEYMMDDSKASCLNTGNPIWKKAQYISANIDAAMSTVNSRTIERWEANL